IAEFANKTSPTADMLAAMVPIGAAKTSWQQTSGSLASSIQIAAQQLLLAFVKADTQQPIQTLQDAIQYVIDQMLTSGDYVTACSVGYSLTPGGSNIGDLAIVASMLRGDGLAQQNALAESIDVSVASTTGPSLQFVGASLIDRLSQDWPGGSGIRLQLAATDASRSLLTNGDFEIASIANAPDGWVFSPGTIGTTVLLSVPEVQTVVISGSPTGGAYYLRLTLGGITYTTAALAYNAAASAVQSALRAIPGLAAITVSASGSSPNYTHTITFTGVAGNIAQLTSINQLTGGSTPSLTHATTTDGDDGAYKGVALIFASDGTELTAAHAPLTLQSEAVYFVHCRMKRVGSTAGGVVKLEIIDAIGGSVISDDAGNSNVLTINATSISTSSHDSVSFSFRLPANQKQPVFLRIRISTAIDSSCSIYFDQVAVAAGRELYPGGPFVQVFAGATAPGVNDTWTLAITNDRSGKIQDWYNRAFDMASKRLLLPTSGGGSLIPDSVIG
ncbi:MAG TPA: hypothetical protein VG713_06905, partial [Pirellulales bacterium]|nr:hypothetical protein [Pirellulales bacterium]